MIESILSYLKFGNRFYGIELTQIAGEDIHHGIILKKEKRQLNLQASFESKSIEDLNASIPKSKPISLVINTNLVLTKRVQSKANDPIKLVHMAFPNIKVEDFYYEVVIQRDNHFISICRKTYVDDLLKIYASKNITIIDFTLGNLICVDLIPFIDNDIIQTSNVIVHKKDDLINEITAKGTQSEINHNINGINIKNTLLLSFASALSLVVEHQNIQSGFTNKKKELSETYERKQFISQFFKFGLAALFAVLLINFLFFNHYYSEVNALKENSRVLQVAKTNMVSLNEKIQRTEKLVGDILKSSSSKSSFYVDLIINTLPESVLLKELNYQPLLKKIKENKVIENGKNRILISGQSNKNVEFSQWIDLIENFRWVRSVEILSFEDINTSSEFTINLNIKDDTED